VIGDRAGLDQLAALAILRRPQTDADRGALVRSALRVLSRQMITGIHTDAIRVIFNGPRELTVLGPRLHHVHPHIGLVEMAVVQADGDPAPAERRRRAW
jgi:hypothetical protein